METSTVIIPLSEYDKLRGFKEAIEKGGAVASWMESSGSYSYTYRYYTKDEAIATFGNKITALKREIDCLKPKTESNVKKLSLWEFWGWSRKQ